MKNCYFDNNSTTPINTHVQKVIIDVLKHDFGNPSNLHDKGKKARDIIEISRQQVADIINAEKSEVYFTSCGTESNNLAIKGLQSIYNSGKNHIITSMTEHSSVYETIKSLEKNDLEVTYLPVDHEGKISIVDLKKSIQENTALISIMYANNETGVIQDIDKISKIAHENEIIFHCDAIQAVGKIPVNINNPEIDLLSISSHKLYGPKGIGALYVRRGLSLSPLMQGGGQERKLRSGTENVPYIAGFGEACKISMRLLDKDTVHLLHLKNLLYRGLQEKIECTKLNGSFKDSLPNTLNISFPGCESETLIQDLNTMGIYVSGGAACGSLGRGKSRVLKAMNLASTELFSAIRFSLGRDTKKDDVLFLIETLSEIIRQLV